jgi:hypothetical protein
MYNFKSLYSVIRCRKYKGKILPVHNMKAYRRVEVELHRFKTSTQNGSKRLPSNPSRFREENILFLDLEGVSHNGTYLSVQATMIYVYRRTEVQLHSLSTLVLDATAR